MDYSSLIISMCIVAYGAYEYRRRGKAHALALAYLRRGEIPPDATPGRPPWNILTTGIMCILLAGFVGTLFYFAIRAGSRYGHPLWIAGSAFAVPLVILILVFTRDFRQYLHTRKTSKDPRQ